MTPDLITDVIPDCFHGRSEATDEDFDRADALLADFNRALPVVKISTRPLRRTVYDLDTGGSMELVRVPASLTDLRAQLRRRFIRSGVPLNRSAYTK